MLKLATKFAPEPAAFEQAHRAGFANAELFLSETIVSNWEKIVSVARKYPLEYAVHCPNRYELSESTLQHVASLYQALGCGAVVVHQPHMDKFGSRLRELSPGIPLAVENHHLTIPEFDQWADRNPGLTLDVEHLWKFTLLDAPLDDLFKAVRRFLERWSGKLRHVHMPGYLPGNDEHRPMYCSRELVLGAFSLFAEFKFGGLIVSEVSTEFQNPFELEMDVLLFQRWQEKAKGA
jgi:sugar phosphate isomerase/epimerase